MAIPMIETGYRPEFGLGALYQGYNAANADQSAQEEIVRQFLANQREKQMQPLDIQGKELSNQASVFDNMVKALQGNQAQAQNQPELIQRFAQAKDASNQTALRKNELESIQHPYAVRNVPIEENIRAQNLDNQNQIAQIDRLLDSGDTPPASIPTLQQERQRLIDRIAVTPEYQQKFNIEQVKGVNALERAQQAADAARERTLISTASRDRSTDVQAEVRREMIAQQEAEAAAKRAKLKDIPANAAKVIVTNDSALSKVNAAIQGLKDRPESIGWKGYQPDEILQRTDKEGVAVRALIADISSLKVHDRSGASVTASEFPRLKPFVPRVTDTYETAMKKLQQFQAELQDVTDSYKAIYSRDRGFNELPPLSSEITNKATSTEDDPLGIRKGSK